MGLCRPTPVVITSGGGDVSGFVSRTISSISAPYTYLAWTLDGNHYELDHWYVDNFSVQLPSFDAQPYVIETEAVHNETFIPRATVLNGCESTATFYVTLTMGNTVYDNTQMVTDLAGYTFPYRKQLKSLTYYGYQNKHELGVFESHKFHKLTDKSKVGCKDVYK